MRKGATEELQAMSMEWLRCPICTQLSQGQLLHQAKANMTTLRLWCPYTLSFKQASP